VWRATLYIMLHAARCFDAPPLLFFSVAPFSAEGKLLMRIRMSLSGVLLIHGVTLLAQTTSKHNLTRRILPLLLLIN
jgi:hypothetical protein